EILLELRDLDELVLGQVVERLPRVGRRPPDLQREDSARFSQSDVLFHGARAERPATAHGAVERRGACLAVIGLLYRHSDAGSDSGPIALDPDKTYVDPVIAAARVLEQPHRVPVARDGAADLRDDVLVAVTIEVGERDAMA